jgi:TRAP-type mannitol/chloroaromatic compound transport system permease small subunit
MPVDVPTVDAEREKDFPPIFYATIRIIDNFSDVIGRFLALAMILLVLMMTYEVFARYLFSAPTMWVYESSFMVNGASFMLGCAYALLKGAHVRTDIFWETYSERKKGIIDLTSYLVLFFPSMITLMYIGYDAAEYSWTINERSQESMWRVIMWPFRASIPVAALLFMIQGVSETLKCVYQVRYGREFQHREKLEI